LIICAKLLDCSLNKLRATQQPADGADDVRNVQIARGDLVQHRCEQKKVLTIDERRLQIRPPGQTLFQFQGGIKAAEPVAQN